MTFSIIGTGNMAWFLAARLTATEHSCTAIYARNTIAAKGLATTVKATYKTIKDTLIDTDICFIAVPDHAIEEVVKQLNVVDTTLLVHTAGAMGLDILQSATPHHAILWTIYSILKNDLPQHRNIPMIWEASTVEAKEKILTIAQAISDTVYEANTQQRQWLHLSAVMSNNFINHLLAICEQICHEEQLPFTLLQPIIKQTIDRIAHHSPQELQTGPAKRGDNVTIQKHFELLQAHPEWQAIYKVLTEGIRKQYKE